MKIAVHTPYGTMTKESGLIYLLSNYLNTVLNEVVQLRCNGAFSLCDRDEENGGKREIDTCMKCKCNQKSLASWATTQSLDLSLFMSSDEIVQSRRWINALSNEQLKKVTLKGINLFKLCSHSLMLRCGTSDPDTANKKHEQLIRRMILSAARMCLATQRFHNQVNPDLSLIAVGNDYISRAFFEQSRLQKRDVAIFSLDINERCIKIYHPRREKMFACQLFIMDISTMRSDAKTWPKEVIAVLEDILSFLEVSSSQMSLPLAR